MIITIDGPAGTGKSTVAKRLAKALSFFYFDTGAMYRSFSYFLLEQKIDISDEEKVETALSDFTYDIKDKDGEKVYLVNGKDVSENIRTPLVTSAVSKVSAYEFVRKKLVKIQREFGSQKNAVFEGRDMGTVVFPNADLKIFLDADPNVRAERRYKEYLAKFPEKESEISLNKILEDIQYRDHHDSTRKISPLKKALDSVVIDTSKMNIEEVVNKILAAAKKKVKKRNKLFYAFIKFLAKTLFKLFYGLKVRGIENVPVGSAFIAPNHVSFFDPPVIAVSCPYEINFLARASLFRNKLFGWFIRKLNAHPIGVSASDRKTFKVTFDLLKDSQKVLIFPEGERSRSEDIAEIKSGLGFLAWKSNTPIVPAFIEGTFRAWPRFKKFPRLFKRITCTFGKPICIQDFNHLDRDQAIKEITKKTQEALIELKESQKK